LPRYASNRESGEVNISILQPTSLLVLPSHPWRTHRL